jgi:hypothetical protein
MIITGLVAALAPVAPALAVLVVTDAPAPTAGHEDAHDRRYATTSPGIDFLSCDNGTPCGATARASSDAAPDSP